MAPKAYVYAVLRRDHEHHTDRKGTLALVEIHDGQESANAAAKAHLVKESAKGGPSYDEEIEEGVAKDGGYEGQCWTRHDKRDNFVVSVKKMELKGDAGAASKTASSSSTKKSATVLAKRSKPENDDDDDDEDTAAPAAKKKPAADKSSKKKEAPEGKPGALKGLTLLFTGTFDSMDRDTSVGTVIKYGGQMTKKLDEADWIILGVKAGPKKLEEIKAKNLQTMDEAEFLEMLKTGKAPA